MEREPLKSLSEDENQKQVEYRETCYKNVKNKNASENKDCLMFSNIKKRTAMFRKYLK